MTQTNFNKTITGLAFGESVQQAVWNKGRPIPGRDSSLYREDTCGATIYRHAYGNTNHTEGWEIDHIFPKSLGGSDDLSNLQPLHWKNNRAKGDKIGTWTCEVKT